MRSWRATRIVVLVALLTGSVALLFSRPRAHILVESYCRDLQMAPAEGRCASVPLQAVRWEVSAPPAFNDDLAASFREALGVRCAEGCLALHEVALSPVWVERPGFFDGFGVLHVGVEITRRVGGCVDRSTMRMDVRVDQGRRGQEWVAASIAGRMAGVRTMLSFGEWAPPSSTTTTSSAKAREGE